MRVLKAYILSMGVGLLVSALLWGCTVSKEAGQAPDKAGQAAPAYTKHKADAPAKQAYESAPVQSTAGGNKSEVKYAEGGSAQTAMQAPSPYKEQLESVQMGQSAPKRTMSARGERRAMMIPLGDGLGYYNAAAPRAFEPQQPPPAYFGRDNFEHKEVNPVRLVSEEPVSTFSIDVDTTSYSFVRKSLNSGHLPQKDAVRVEEMINYFDYNYMTPHDALRPFLPTIAVYPTPWNPNTKLIHIGIKGLDVERARKPRANLVFLIDVSGSMSSPDKLPLLKQSFKLLVDSLEPDDTVAIVVYAGAAGTVLEPTYVSEKGRIKAALEHLQAGGSTAGGEGIRQAYALARANYDKRAVNRVILATDGDFNVGITNAEELKGFVERERESGIYLSALGFGMGNYNDQMMQKLAQNGNGNAAYIDTLNEARKVLVNEASSTLFPIARDVKIQVEFNPSRVAEYRLIGYETRMLNRADFNNDKVDAGDIGSGHCVTAIYEITPVESDARLIDDLRYKKGQNLAPKKGDEYAFLKIRYKLPKEEKSRLMTRPIGKAQEYRRIKDVPVDIRYAASVAAFGQLLRGTPYIKGFSCDEIVSLARPARGDDPFGYRSEFIGLVLAAKSADAIPALP